MTADPPKIQEWPLTDPRVVQCELCGALGTFAELYRLDSADTRCHGTKRRTCRCAGGCCACHWHGSKPCQGCNDCHDPFFFPPAMQRRCPTCDQPIEE